MKCAAIYDQCLLFGHGGPLNHTHAMTQFGRAAQAGSALACLFLGMSFYARAYGLPQDDDQARHWLNKVVNMPSAEWETLKRRGKFLPILPSPPKLKRENIHTIFLLKVIPLPLPSLPPFPSSPSPP